MKTKNLIYKIRATREFNDWYKEQVAKERLQIDSRLMNIQFEGHFGIKKDLDHEIWELKWQGGRRIYFTFFPKKNILLLLGGNKNGQSKDIQKARKILSKYCT